MKIAIDCQSPLLQKSLEIFLKKYMSQKDECDFLVSDTRLDSDKRVCFISQDEGAYIKKPFTRAQLVLGVERFFKEPEVSLPKPRPQAKLTLNDKELERKLNLLTHKFTNALVETIKTHYEK